MNNEDDAELINFAVLSPYWHPHVLLVASSFETTVAVITMPSVRQLSLSSVS